MTSEGFDRAAGWCALGAGTAALAYSMTFAIVVQNGDRWALWASTVILGLGAAAAAPVTVAFYLRLRPLDEGLSLLALVAGLAASVGSFLHAAFDLAVLANPPTSAVDIPSPTDPRGVSTFLLAGVAMALLATLLSRAASTPRYLPALGWTTALLLAWVWLGRLTALDPKTPWVAPAVVGSGFLGVPLWYLSIGRLLGWHAAPASKRSLRQRR